MTLEHEIKEVFMIQDIFPHIYNNEYKPVAPDSNSIILVYENGKCFFSREENSDTITLPRFKELDGQLSNLYENYIYLFSIDDDRFYLIPGLDTNLLPEYDFYEARVLRYAHPQYLSFAVITGHQLYQWFERDKIIGQDTNSSLTNEMMMAFASGKEPQYG